MNNIKIFENNELGAKIRTITEDEQVLFCASDVAKALEYVDAYSMTRRLDPDDLVKLEGTTTAGVVVPDMLYLSEAALYVAILGSQKPEARAFKKWVTSEVLPSIRKTGTYSFDNPKTSKEKYIKAVEEDNIILRALGYSQGEMRKQALLTGIAMENSTGDVIIPDILRNDTNAINPDDTLSPYEGSHAALVRIGSQGLKPTAIAKMYSNKLITSIVVNDALTTLGYQKCLNFNTFKNYYVLTEKGSLVGNTTKLSSGPKKGLLIVDNWLFDTNHTHFYNELDNYLRQLIQNNKQLI